MERDSGNESDPKASNLKISSVDEEAYESDTNTKAEKEITMKKGYGNENEKERKLKKKWR